MSNDLPLTGKRIAITRRSEEAVESAALLEAVGAEAVILSAIVLQPLASEEVRETLRHSGDFSFLVFVSPAAVQRFAELGGRAQSAVAAMGPATARRVRELLDVEPWLPDHYRGERLGQSLPVTGGTRVLVLGAEGGDPALGEALRRRSIQETHLALYATLPAPTPPTLADELARGLDVITFASPSAVRAFVGMAGVEALRNVVIGCIGGTTANAVREQGIEPQVVARSHTFAGLVNALIEYYAQNS